MDQFIHLAKYLIAWNPLTLGEFAAGDFDVAGKLNAIQQGVQRFGIDEVRGGAAILRDEDGAVPLGRARGRRGGARDRDVSSDWGDFHARWRFDARSCAERGQLNEGLARDLAESARSEGRASRKGFQCDPS